MHKGTHMCKYRKHYVMAERKSSGMHNYKDQRDVARLEMTVSCLQCVISLHEDSGLHEAQDDKF